MEIVNDRNAIVEGLDEDRIRCVVLQYVPVDLAQRTSELLRVCVYAVINAVLQCYYSVLSYSRCSCHREEEEDEQLNAMMKNFSKSFEVAPPPPPLCTGADVFITFDLMTVPGPAPNINAALVLSTASLSDERIILV